MKKLYRKGTVHPSPSSIPSPSLSEQFSLSYLPAAILALAAALSAEDRVVLAYLLSCSSASATAATPFNFNPTKSHHNHPPSSTCYCFSCYTSYWARWDSSPSRHVIHEIIDAFEDELFSQRKKKKQSMSRREKRKGNGKKGLDLNSNLNSEGSTRVNPELDRAESGEQEGGQLGNGDGETGEKQGSMRKLFSFIGDRIWGSVLG